MGCYKRQNEMEKVCNLAVRGLDELLDYSVILNIISRIPIMNRRPPGVGIVNFAYWLAKMIAHTKNPI